MGAIDWNLVFTETSKVLAGGVAGVLFATWYKDFKDKKKSQKELFSLLFALRGAPLNYQSVVVLIVVVLVTIVEILFPRIVVIVLRRTPIVVISKTANHI